MVGRGKHVQIPERGHETDAARRVRLGWVREQSGQPMAALDTFSFNAARLTGNIENLVGSVALPVGLVGPLLFDGDAARGWITAPFATTEGALVASASRGAYAVSRNGSVATRVLSQKMIRAPRFDLDDLASAFEFGQWAEQQFTQISTLIAGVSKHARLIRLRPLQIGRSVDLHFEYETGDASGQNMTTACTWRSCLWMEQELADHPRIRLRSFCVEGNSAGDKKLTHRSLVNGRGMRVTAECRVSEETLHRVLKVSKDDMLRAHNINVTGTALAAGISPNINVANAIAAIFAATGQDLACVHESGTAILNIEPDGDGIYASLLIPALAIGTVGGGTGLPQQADYLSMLGCSGTGTAARLGEIIAGFSLALDLSTLSAVIGGQFASAHERLGRNRPVAWFTSADLTTDFFARELAESLPADRHVEAVKIVGDATASSVISELTHRVSTQKLVGVLPIDVHLYDEALPLELMVKAKPLDDEVLLAAQRLVSLAGGRLADAWSRGSDVSDFLGTHLRELELYRDPGPAREIMPRCFGIHRDPQREAFLLLLERLGDDVILLNTGDRPQDWTDEHIRVALDGIGGLHGHWLGREDELASLKWLGAPTAATRVASMADLWRGLFEHHRAEFPDVITNGLFERVAALIDTLDHWWPEFERMPRTLVHNDFNSRNVGLRQGVTDDGRHLSLVAYDWELTTVHIPQRDLVELLAYVLPPDVPANRVHALSEHHRRVVQAHSDIAVDPALWSRGFELALADFLVRRLSLYLMVHTVHRLSFIERVVATVARLLDICGETVAYSRGTPAVAS